MKIFFIGALVLLVPAAALTQPTMGVFFTYAPGNIYYSIMDGPPHLFDGYVYAHNLYCHLLSCEFQLVIENPAIMVQSTEYLQDSASIGEPTAGVSISYWPPLDGWSPGYNLLCILHLIAIDRCTSCGGTLVDVSIIISPHPDSGEILGTRWPTTDTFQFIGLTSIVCPGGAATNEPSWGAIKCMFNE